MAIRTKKKTFTITEEDINGVEKQVEKHITVTTHPARAGLTLKWELIHKIAPVLGSISTLKSKDEHAKKLDVFAQIAENPDIIKNVVEALMNALHVEETVNLILRLLATSKVDGQDLSNESVFDEVFAGEYGLLYQTLIFVIQTNFKSVFKMGDISKLLKKYLPEEDKKEETKEKTTQE